MSRDPLVSAIIVFLDEERFLEEAIESVFGQSYDAWELLLVDDGSTDGSAEIARDWAARHPHRVRYLEHPGHVNRGMSASRNLGIAEAGGEYVAWLDGDDVWLPEKLRRQVDILERHPEAAMVYGPLHVWYGWTGDPVDRERDFIQPLGFSADTLITPPRLLVAFLADDLLTPGGEMVRRAVFLEVGGFDASFRGMYEDGVVHAKICMEYPVYASGTCVYRYRQHPDSCCNVSVAEGTDRVARARYLTWLKDHLVAEGREGGELGRLVKDLHGGNRDGPKSRADRAARTGLRRAREIADRMVPAPLRRLVGLVGFGGRGVPPSGWVHLGNLRRVTPISRVFGFDRGRPVDRYYIEQFLASHENDVRGAVLEVGDPDYTRRFGGNRVTRSDVLHARAGNPAATVVGDLSTGEGVPSEAYDCVILTQVLPFLWDFEGALEHAHDALKPGGVLLLTVPGISQISRFDADRWGDFWRFTSMSVERLLDEVFTGGRVEIAVFGNVLTATAFLHGIAAEELSAHELDFKDPNFELTIAVRARRAEAHAFPEEVPRAGERRSADGPA